MFLNLFADILSNTALIPLFDNKKKDLVHNELTFLQKVSIIFRVYMKPRRYIFYPFLFLAISKQQK